MQAEGELRSNSDESDRVRDLQDKVADMKAEVSHSLFFVINYSPTLSCRLMFIIIHVSNIKRLTYVYVNNTNIPNTLLNPSSLTTYHNKSQTAISDTNN